MFENQRICHSLHKEEFYHHLSSGPIYMVPRIHLAKRESLEKNYQVFFQKLTIDDF